MRSQLDCCDDRLPRQTFDLKTRATLPIRMDVHNHQTHLSYRLHTLRGLYGSFEREFYDMCRSALLKYAFQVHIGNMDGIFVAYHNTAEVFGFQYVARETMDEILYGNSATADAAFHHILNVYNEILDRICADHPSDVPLRLTFSLDKTGTKLLLFVETLEAVADGSDSNGFVPNSSSFSQYQFACYSSLNGFRAENPFITDPNADWTLHFSLAKIKSSQPEFETARQKAQRSSLNAAEEDVLKSPLFRGISRFVSQVSSERPSGPDIIAPWTIIKVRPHGV